MGLSQFAMLGMYASGIVVGKGPVECWASHIADPVTANGFAYATKYVPGLRARSTNPQQNTKTPKNTRGSLRCGEAKLSEYSAESRFIALREAKLSEYSAESRLIALRGGHKIKNATRATNVRHKTQTHRTHEARAG